MSVMNVNYFTTHSFISDIDVTHLTSLVRTSLFKKRKQFFLMRTEDRTKKAQIRTRT